MELVVAFVVGAVVGGVAVFFISRNNKKLFDEMYTKVDALQKKIEEILAKLPK